MLANTIQEFVNMPDLFELSGDEGYLKGQIGHHIMQGNHLDEADLVLLSCDEWRGSSKKQQTGNDWQIRHEFYQQYLWHQDLKIADAGMVKQGALLSDTYASLRYAVKLLVNAGKRVLVLGGSHDLTLPLYRAISDGLHVIEATAVDALIDLDQQNPFPAKRFLFEMLTGQPNYVRHFNLVGFQSYLVNPNLLETIDKLRFDCYRVGQAQENMQEVEPALRNSQLISVDLNALAHAYAPAAGISPNGFTGQEACRIMQFAGMSPLNQVTGIFGYEKHETSGITARQIAQMAWYYLDGLQKQLHEAPLADRTAYLEFHTTGGAVDTVFLCSKHTGRWWMELPNKKMIACTEHDYLQASQNEMPERWLRAQERLD